MIRRRRPTREIPFSFDSFLDIVANVVGIIIRLILVVWVGARTYSSLQPPLPVIDAGSEQESMSREPQDPIQQELARHRAEMAEAQERLLQQLRQLDDAKEGHAQDLKSFSSLTSRLRTLEEERTTTERALSNHRQTGQAAALTLAEVRQRSQRLVQEIHSFEKLHPLRKTLRYRTPVSRPVNSEELFFECHQGRVTFIDVAALLAEVQHGLDDKAKLLQTQWQVADMAGPVGPYRLRYVMERERGMLDAAFRGGAPEATGSFRYGLSEWQIEPITPARGETPDRATTPASDFRRVVDALDPQLTVVTFWVYPDSFALYRQLRDYLYDRDLVVAGRPLPEGVPMASSRRGTVSRGQ